MGAITDQADVAFANYNSPNDPASGNKKPIKEEIRATFSTVETVIDDNAQVAAEGLAEADARIAVLEATAGEPGLNFDTKAQMDASTNHPPNTVAYVNFDPVINNNGKYLLQPTSPAMWVKTIDRIDLETERAEAEEARLAATRRNFTGDAQGPIPMATAVERGFSVQMIDPTRQLFRGLGWDDGNGQAPLVALPAASVFAHTGTSLYGVPVFGDSTTMGFEGGPPINTASVYGHYTFTGGPRYSSTAGNTDLHEVDGGGTFNLGETPCSGIARAFSEQVIADGLDVSDWRLFTWTSGVPGSKIAEWQKGQPNYNALVNAVTAAKAQAIAIGRANFVVPACFVALGVNDAETISYADAYNGLKQIQTDLQADIKVITGQTQPVAFIMQQQEATVVNTDGNVARAQVDLCRLEPGFYFADTVYNRDFSDAGVHMFSLDYYLAARPAGRVLKYLIVDGAVPRTVLPIAAWARHIEDGVGYTVYIKVKPITRPWTINSVALKLINDYGLVIRDDVENYRTLAGIEIVNGDTIVCQVDALGANPYARVALDYDPFLDGNKNGYSDFHDGMFGDVYVNGVIYPEWNVMPSFQLPIQILG